MELTMDDIEQQQHDINNLPPVLRALSENTEVGSIKILLAKVDSLLSTILSEEDIKGLTNSKLGGIGYLPAGESYPKAKDNKPLVLLAQINFAQMQSVSSDKSLAYRLPSTGILQIYIDGRNSLYGEGGYQGNGLPSSSYQVRFWSDPSLEVNMNEVVAYKDYITGEATNLDWGDDNHQSLPFKLGKEFAITFSLTAQSCHPNCHEYEKLSKDIKLPSQEVFIANTELSDHALTTFRVFEDDMGLDYPENVTSYYLYENMANLGGSHLLGYPDFAQTDPRSSRSHLDDFVLLMQIGSEADGIMWGDCGQAHFFIHPDDLAKSDFSKLVYSWDCG
jgi:uncharacterized protein YwqG